MAEDSRILTGLPVLPSENIDPKLWGEILIIYRAIQNLLLGVSQYTGIDGPSAAEIATMNPTAYLLGQNVTRLYIPVAQNTVRGQVLHVYNSGGIAAASLASATSAATRAHGVANTNAGAGTRCEIIMFQGLTTAIGGMTPGTDYYLSTTPGAIQNLPPVAAGQIVQQLGVSITSGELLLNIASQFTQL